MAVKYHCHVIRTYIRFGIILTQFYDNFSRQEHQIDKCRIGIVKLLRFLGFILYPLSFFLYSTFKSVDFNCERFYCIESCVPKLVYYIALKNGNVRIHG